jgi:hypothetical protein
MTSKPERYLGVFCLLLIGAVAIPAVIEWCRGSNRPVANVSARGE